MNSAAIKIFSQLRMICFSLFIKSTLYFKV
jgi:hypothetical protein